jgi:hypothetical protein
MTFAALTHREPHPITDPAIAAANHDTICGPRGYCGPFINEAYYTAFPDGLWHGIGDCSLCGNSCSVATEHEKERLANERRLTA